VFLRSLTLKGFKSFADPTTLDFEPGVTVVVGPNGSGKSNVVDAVAWVLGAQGPRTVRSAKMDDVIFAGSPRRAALGRAEVSLTIDNSAGLLPIDFSEVTITRVLFRNGESEYAINGVSCRLLDVQELLSDSGVGRQQHVIVSQGQLDAVLNARPEDRRMIIEEAAGVLKYRRRREKSQRRLEAIENDLQRLADLLREVSRQLKPLERQALAAGRHAELTVELAALRRYAAGREFAGLTSRLTAGAERRAAIALMEKEALAELDLVEQQTDGAETVLGGLRRHSESADLAEALSRAERLSERCRGLRALIGERRRGLSRDLGATLDSGLIANLEAEGHRIHEQLAEVDAEVALLVPQADELDRAEARLAHEARAVEEAWGRQSDLVGSGSRAPRPAARAAAEVRGELTARRSSLERTIAELDRLEVAAEALDHKLVRVEREAATHRSDIDEALRQVPVLEHNLERADLAVSQAEALEGDREEARREVEAELNRWSARAEALGQALEEAWARAGAARLAEVAGFVGTLLDVVEVDEGWEAAFEAAAGEAVAAVVLDGVGAARRGLELLRSRDASGAVLALGDAGPVAPDAAGLDGLDRVRAHVQSRLPGADRLLDRLVGHAVAVGEWTEAFELAASRPDLVVVTRTGDRFAPSGWRTGGSRTVATAEALEEARRRTESAQRASEQAEEASNSVKAILGERRSARSGLSRALDAAKGKGESSAESLSRLEDHRRELLAEQQSLQEHRLELAQRVQREQERVATLAESLPELELNDRAEAERASEERAERARLGERTAAVASLRREFEVQAAGLEERRGLLARRLSEVEERLRRDGVQREEAAARRQALELSVVATERLAELVDSYISTAEGVVKALRTDRQAEAEGLRQAEERVEDLRGQRTACERRLGDLRDKAARTEVEETETKVRLEALTETVLRDLECEPQDTVDAPRPELPDGQTPAGRTRDIERELRQMGPINPLALSEHRELAERHSFISGQLDDVKTARRELAKVIRAVDDEIVDVFTAAFADVSTNFERLFATLFPGGEGRLRLTDPDNLLDTGIDVEAKPSGKNVRRLSLLSGGERSLTAMAFLFAVFRSRPSPFYLMDEVEAALDDVNLLRFLDLLQEFREEAQLVVVSHQRRTMEAADCLYGVTMQPGGSSKVVSERIDRVLEREGWAVSS
jgi:chromosome segregation protein